MATRQSAEPREPGLVRPALVLIAASGGGAICILAGMLGADAVLRALGEGRLSDPQIEALFTAAIFLPMLMLALIGNAVSGGGRVALGRQPVQAGATGLAIGACGLLIAAGLGGIFGGVSNAGGGTGFSALILLGMAVTLLQAGTEEVLLRGWLQPVLVRHWGAWVAVPVAALLFMMLHLLGGVRAPLTLLNLFLGGLLFGMLALRTGGLAAPVLAHWAWNSCEAYLLGLDPNPGVGAFGAVFDLDLIGGASWGGSGEGLNGSVSVTLVLVLLLGPLTLLRNRARDPAPAPVMPASEPAPEAAAVPLPRRSKRDAFFLGEADSV